MIRLRPRNVRTRLTLWYVLVLGGLLAIYAAGTSTVFFYSLRRELDINLLQDFETVEGLVAHHPEAEEAGRSRYLEVWSPEGKLQHRSASLTGFSLGGPPSPEEGKGGLVPVSLTLADGTGLRTVTGRSFRGDRTLVIRLAHSEERLWHELRGLLGGIAFGIPIALAAAGLGGYLLARRALSPVEAMTRQAAKISGESLSERLPVENPEDELGQLARVLNQSLDRLQAAFQQLRRFTADASHELRTPLTAVRSVGEVAMQDRRATEEYREAIGSMLEEVDRLTRLVDSLLVLSRTDAGPLSLNRMWLPLGDMVQEAVSLVEVLAEEKGQKVLVDAAPLAVSADRLILRQALINLLDNAIKYSPPGATIAIRTRMRHPREIVVEVVDHGPGISSQHRHKVFERFYRVDPARSRDQGGAGLGLAIADWAVKAHGGSIELESEEGRGSTFRIVLPAAEPAGTEIT
jgi:heavy metal sensor kinase